MATPTPTKTSSAPKYSIGYTHTSRTECTAFIAKLKGRTKFTEEKEPTLKVYKHAVDNTAHKSSGRSGLSV